MKNIKKKIIALTLLGLVNATTISCAKAEKEAEVIIDDENIIIDENVEETIEKIIKEEVDPIEKKTVLTCINETFFREYQPDGEILGIIPEGRTVDLVEKVNDEWSFIAYNGTLGCALTSDFKKGSSYEINDVYKYIARLTENSFLELIDGETIEVFENELFEVYKTAERALVSNRDFVGYISNELLDRLDGEIISIDLSDQVLTLYNDGDIITSFPVIAGSEDAPCYEGLHDYQDQIENYLFYSYGYIFGGNRESYLYGGDTYKTDGTLGVVEVSENDMKLLNDLVDSKVRVLVKK